jgi:hypothetical protein
MRDHAKLYLQGAMLQIADQDDQIVMSKEALLKSLYQHLQLYGFSRAEILEMLRDPEIAEGVFFEPVTSLQTHVVLRCKRQYAAYLHLVRKDSSQAERSYIACVMLGWDPGSAAASVGRILPYPHGF